MKHETDLIWYEDGKLYTQREYLQRKWQKAVSEEQAMEYVRKKMFVQGIIKRAEELKTNNK